MTASLWEQKQITKECFGGEQERDCENCPANLAQGGICCFGDPDKHDPSDDDCQECTMFEECRQEVIDVESMKIEEEAEAQNAYFSRFDPKWRKTGRRQKPRIRSRTVSRIAKEMEEEDLVQIGRGTRPVITTPNEYKRRKKMQFKKKMREYAPTEEADSEEYEEEVEGLFNRFWKDTTWGAGQGFFEMGAEFFRTHRLP